MLVKVKKPVRHGAHHARCPWSSPGGTHLSGMLHSSLFLKLSCRTLGKKEPEVQHQSSDLLLERQVGAPWCHLTPLCWAALIQLLNLLASPFLTGLFATTWWMVHQFSFQRQTTFTLTLNIIKASVLWNSPGSLPAEPQEKP